MSLKDTIRGAREEAAANISPLNRPSSSEETGDSGAQSTTDQGFERKSVSRAKPTREAAAGVRVVNSSRKGKPAGEMTKQEQKSERKKEREKQDRRYAVSQMLLEEDPAYQRHHKIWWRILIVGLVFMVIALISYTYVSSVGEGAPMWVMVVSMGSMVLAYVAVIISFLYDWFHVRPIRRNNEQRVASMTEKKINKTLRERDKEKK